MFSQSVVRPFLSGLASLFILSTVAVAQQRSFSVEHRNGERPLSQVLGKASGKLQKRLAAGRSAISLGAADLDGDGTPDLVTGYAVGSGGALFVQHGNNAAVAPGEAEASLLNAGQPVTPFSSTADALELPVRPELLKTGDLHGMGYVDLLAAQKGDTHAYLLAAQGHTGFAAAQPLPLAGAVQALGIWRAPGGANLIVASVCASSACGIQVLDQSGNNIAFFRLASAVTSFELANANGGHTADLIGITRDAVIVIDGDSMLSGSPFVTRIPVSGAVAVTTGLFAYDRRTVPQIAILGDDATLRVFARTGVDHSVLTGAQVMALRRLTSQPHSTPASAIDLRSLAWTETETVSNVGPGGPATMLRGRFSGGGFDDLVVMAGSQYIKVAHPLVTEGLTRHSVPIVTVDSGRSGVIAAVAMRLNASGLSGTVTADGTLQPMYTVPSSYRTMNVNTTADATPNTTSENACINHAAGCTLRAAVAVANSDAATTGTSRVDTINIAAGTYAFSATNSGSTTNANGDVDYHLPITSSISFVGAGAATTIINGNNLDKVVSINPDTTATPYDVFFSNLTLENGKTPTTDVYDYYGGLMDADLGGPGVLQFSNCTLTNGTSVNTEGGMGYISNVAASNSPASPAGLLEIDNSTISSNQTPATLNGGAIWLGADIPLTISSTTFSGNAGGADGGAIFMEEIAGNGGSAATVNITGSLFSANTATQAGGAIWLNDSAATFDQDTFTNNKVSGGTGGIYGGALYIYNLANSLTISNSTFTGNSATTSGNAVCVDGTTVASTDNQVTIQYSRFKGNTGGTNAVESSCTNGYSKITAANNWWGCNGAATGTGCDTAGTADSRGSVVVSPYTTLTLALNSTSPTANSSITAIGSLGQNSSGTVYSQANDYALIGLPATLKIVQNGGGTTNSSATTLTAAAAPSTSYAAITTTATANAAGAGTATVTVDNATVAANFTVTAADLAITSTHTGNFHAGDTGDTYTLTVSNTGTAATSGTVTLVDTLPSGFTATAMSGTGWTCTVSSLTCTRSDALAASSGYPAVTLTVSIASSAVGTYTNVATVSGGNELATGNDTASDTTLVIAPPTISQAFSPTTIAPGGTSQITFTLGSSASNPATLTGVAFTDTLPSGLIVSSPNGLSTTCTSGTAAAVAGGSSVSLSGASIAAGTTCTVKMNVTSSAAGAYTNTTGAVSSTNGGTGSTASATLTVAVTPTKLVMTSAPATPVTAGGNAGTVQVALEDNSGNIATSNSSATVTLAATGPSGYSQSYSAAATNGVATFNLSSVSLTSAGTYTYTATSSSLTQAVATETVNPGAATAFTLTGLGTFAAPQMSGTVTVTARDSYQNIATGFTGTVTLSSTDPVATFTPSSYQFQSSDAGVKAFSVIFNTAGTQSVTARSGSLTGADTGIVVREAIWVLDNTSQLARLDSTGSQTFTAGSSTTLASAGMLAVDHTGNVWAALKNSNSILEFTAAGAPVTVAGSTSAGVNAPTAIAIDGNGAVWIANSGTNSLSVLSSAGAPVTPSTGYQPAALSNPTGVAVDSSGSVWITNAGSNTVVKVIGAAAPIVTPIANSAASNQLGTRP